MKKSELFSVGQILTHNGHTFRVIKMSRKCDLSCNIDTCAACTHFGATCNMSKSGKRLATYQCLKQLT